MNFNDYFTVFSELRSDIWRLWTIHTTVVVALVGWIVAQRSRFRRIHKIFVTGSYTIFLVIILLSFHKTYNEQNLLLKDFKITQPEINKSISPTGYIHDFLRTDFKEHFHWTLAVAIVFYLIINTIVWSDYVWSKLKITPEPDESPHSDD